MSTNRSLLRKLQALVCLGTLMALCLAFSPARAAPAAPGARPTSTSSTTIVSLTFDDGLVSHDTAMTMMRAHRMVGTFYIVPGLVGTNDYYLPWPDVHALADAGDEIGGHTLHHVVLTTVDPGTARAEVCGSRSALLAQGFFPVTSFAYPDAEVNPTVEQIVAGCGYSSGRGAGDLLGPGCPCPPAESLPPVDPENLRTPIASGTGTTLADLEATVTAAEDHGGGWVPLVFHGICDDRCADEFSVSPAIFGEFLDWLAPRVARGTVVRTVGQVMSATSPPH
jgi:peptidoglycan/xylan/chitin deacetylase (PgdA/CDA1 family)